MHIDTISMTGKIEDLHYSRLHWKKDMLIELDLAHKVEGGKFRFMSDLTHRETDEFFRAYFREVFNSELVMNQAGKNGYERSYNIYRGVNMKACGFIAFGGNGDTYQFYINGNGCQVLADRMVHLYKTAGFFKMKLTRVDIAQDFFHGEHDIKRAQKAFNNGEFQHSNRGRKPTGKYIDDMGSGEGKTLYVGKLASSGRETCIYEKGKQLNSTKYPDWVRWELRLGKRDRVIPLDILVNPASYFVAELPILKTICKGLELTVHAVSSLRAKKEKVQADMLHLMNYASIMYGKLIWTMKNVTNKTENEIFEAIAREGIPTRLVL